MPELARVQPVSEATLTRNRLWALVAVSVCMSVTAFMLGMQLGHTAPAEVVEPKDALISESVLTGDLEVLLQKVRLADRDAHLRFPTELPQSPEPVVVVEGQEPVLPSFELPVAAEATGSGSLVVLGGASAEATRTGPWAVAVLRAAPDRAEAELAALQSEGHAVWADDAIVDGRAERRVQVGGFETEDGAKAAVATWKARYGGEPVVVRVK